MGFLVFWSICWSSSFVHFKNGPEYLTRGTALILITLIRFLLCSLVSSSFLVLLRNTFKNFFLSSLVVKWCPLPVFPSTCKLPLLRVLWFFLDLVVRFCPSFIVFRHSLLTWHIFLYQIPFLYLQWISSLTVFRVLILFHFLANTLMSSMYIRWMIFFQRFIKFVSACTFPKDMIE